ncbi:MAG: pyridoxine/pyridoxamine 5'-phosphate oxidase [Candidatus Xenolissoclinum pacificiensis L6]|uniref:Pyridoxine/pyridoxamine 5'-phosphate oxidase n=1 Tax=Candidatus Xenolissoclinum pacificiensis L6 TaxID=1401685 RepID=W2UYZ2_9RICK|nr:MAG: pyridoxine/pyridoxamine 5'-phosphate oxidase [Candidatus Xenolissoclinum pacificiensis L6]
MRELGPIEIFSRWFAEEERDNQEHCMVLTTCCNDRPLSRTVLLKEFHENIFTFYTNLHSRKSQDILCNNTVHLLFVWKDKQISILGKAEQVSDKRADEYFYSRSQEKQISAIVSKQSNSLSSYKDFINEIESFKGSIIRPEHWSGYDVIAYQMEFLERKCHRRNYRILFKNIEGDKWASTELYP